MGALCDLCSFVCVSGINEDDGDDMIHLTPCPSLQRTGRERRSYVCRQQVMRRQFDRGNFPKDPILGLVGGRIVR